MLEGGGTAGGLLVEVTDGGDESAVSFVFDNDGALLLLYWHNQSPEVRYFCRQPSAPAVTLANDDECVGALINDIPHGDGQEADVSFTATANNVPADAGDAAALSIARYAQTTGVSASTSLAVSGASWGTWDGTASRLSVQAASEPRIDFLATSEMVLIETENGKPSALVCK